MDTPTSFSDFLAALQTGEPDPELVARYVAAHGGTPIIEGNTAHFIAAAQPGRILGIGSEWNSWDARQAMMQPIGDGLLHYQQDFEPDARLDYQFFSVPPNVDLHTVPEKDVQVSRDPLNPRIGLSGLGERSELAMPQYQRPAITEAQPATPTGTLVEGQIESKALGEIRPYVVYLPHGYDHLDSGPYPAIYFQDGGDYLNFGFAPTILDNLIASGQISPVVAVFVPPLHRDDEYDCDDNYVSFFADELVSEVQQRYHLDTNEQWRAIIGPSMGGLISLYIVANRPEVFGLVAAQSAEVRGFASKVDARQVYAANSLLPKVSKLHLVIGSYEACNWRDEQGNCRDLLNPVRELRDILTQRGYPVRYVEQHQGHSWGLWRDTLADALIYFYGINNGHTNQL